MKLPLLQSLITKFPSLLNSHCEALSFRASLRGVQRTTKQSPSSPKAYFLFAAAKLLHVPLALIARRQQPTKQSPSSPRLAVILHIYYADQLPEITRRLQNLNAAGFDYDLYVTAPVPPFGQSVGERLSFCFPPPWRGRLGEGEKKTPLTFIPIPNKGYDIGPFIDALHHIDLDNYDYILKLHTKGKNSPNYTLLNGRRLNNDLWGKVLWNALLGSVRQIRRNIAVMEQNPQIGMLTARYCLTGEPKLYQNFLPQINEELQKMGFPPVDKLAFPAGSMFLARAKILKPFLTYHLDDFTPTDGRIKEGTLAHIVERLFGAVTTAQGCALAPAPHKSYFLTRWFVSLKRFIYQKKRTRTGKTLIKICKLPVYTKS